MSRLKKAYQTDVSAEKEGVWVELDNFPDVEVLLARAGGTNKKYVDALQTRMTPHQRSINRAIMEGKDFSPKVVKEITKIQKELHAEFILLDWRGEEDDNGSPIKYTPALGLEYLNDESMEEFWQDVRSAASSIALFRKEVIELQAKNSKSSSGINSLPGGTKKK